MYRGGGSGFLGIFFFERFHIVQQLSNGVLGGRHVPFEPDENHVVHVVSALHTGRDCSHFVVDVLQNRDMIPRKFTTSAILRLASVTARPLVCATHHSGLYDSKLPLTGHFVIGTSNAGRIEWSADNLINARSLCCTKHQRWTTTTINRIASRTKCIQSPLRDVSLLLSLVGILSKFQVVCRQSYRLHNG